ncbi:MAG: choice-of-anchor B family protein [Bacteroidota bacterium]
MRLALVLFAVLAVPAAVSQSLASDALRSQPTAEPALSLAAAEKGGDTEADLIATLDSSPQWLEGVPFSGRAFGGGVYYGRDWFMGSTVDPSDDVPVEIVLDRFETSNARVFRRDLSYQDGGVGVFRGAAYDVSDPENPRRLNIAFVEDDRLCSGADALWAPGNDTVGCREYLYIYASDYDGDGSTYAGTNGYDLDLLYALALRIPAGRALFEANPSMLSLAFPPIRFVEIEAPSNGIVKVSAQFTSSPDLPSGAAIGFTITDDGGTSIDLSTTHPIADTAFRPSALHNGLDPLQFYTYQAEVRDGSGETLHRSAPIRAKVARNASLVGRWSERRSWADVWGYTAPTGREYALVALQSLGVSIVDISDNTPTEVGFVPTTNGANDSKDVKVIGDYAYLINEVGPVQIIDLSDPSNPQQVGLLDVQPGVVSGGAHNVSVDDQYLYVTGGRTIGNAGLRIYSVAADPTAPALVGEFRPDHFQDVYYHDFYVDGDIGYGPNIYGGGVDILDLSDRANPTLIGTFGYPGSGAHNVCGTTDGGIMYVGDEIGSAGNWTRVFDVSDPLNVEYEADIIVDADAVVHNCYVVGDLLHIGHYTEGYRVFDVSDPLAPEEVAFYDTYIPSNYGVDGVWSIYPFFESGKVAVSDRNGGLFVIQLDASVTTTEPSLEPGQIEMTLGPNPADGPIRIRVRLGAPTQARLSVVDVRGREVMTVFDGDAIGTLRATIEAGDLVPGLYLLRLGAGGETVTRPFSVVR